MTSFKKVGASDERMYGPRKIVACGYTPRQHDPLLAFFKAKGFGQFPVVFVPGREEGSLVKDFVSRPHLYGYQEDPGTQKAIIISGFAEKELQKLLAAFREEGIPRPLLAALTPTSETWSVQALLRELSREAEEMKRLRRKSENRSPDEPGKES